MLTLVSLLPRYVVTGCSNGVVGLWPAEDLYSSPADMPSRAGSVSSSDALAPPGSDAAQSKQQLTHASDGAGGCPLDDCWT